MTESQTASPVVRFGLLSANAEDSDEDMIAVPRWALEILTKIAEMNTGCSAGDAFEPSCWQCAAIRTGKWASECAGRKVKNHGE